MRFRDCFTKDIYAKHQKYSLGKFIKQWFTSPGYRVVVYYRIATYLRQIRFPKHLTNLLGSLIITRLSMVPGIEFPKKFEIGEGLLICHPHDIVIGAGSKIGKNVTIYNGVTLGAKTSKFLDNDDNNEKQRYPIIDDGVTIFSGAKIIGPVAIGKNSIIGANSVVNSSFPENSVIVGAPARLVNKKEDSGQA